MITTNISNAEPSLCPSMLEWYLRECWKKECYTQCGHWPTDEEMDRIAWFYFERLVALEEELA